jgi:cellulose synthase (UDP-forming)
VIRPDSQLPGMPDAVRSGTAVIVNTPLLTLLYFTDVAGYVSYQVPLLTAYFLLMLWITPTRYLPVISSAVGTFATFRMLPTVVSSLVRPFGKPFRVTPKGSSNEANQFDRYSFAWIAGLITITAIAC